ncbi:hypothetical protein CIT292_06375 [Citrobacter youngae ATCC 29220]|uniref:Uncharacterized protein n=1 Tax=Citrobacter youngae ATCC 29220 TaxID=500640 RepID=D4B7X1_9ENTR|nr:hypothetical protein CIT292_06375 [Citrobacter youngae ATCC 29220]
MSCLTWFSSPMPDGASLIRPTAYSHFYTALRYFSCVHKIIKS